MTAKWSLCSTHVPSIKFRCLPRLMRLFSFSTHPNVYAIGYRRSRQCSPLTVFNFASAKPNTCIQLWVFKQDTPTPGNPCIFTESLQNLYRTERSLAPLMLKFISVLLYRVVYIGWKLRILMCLEFNELSVTNRNKIRYFFSSNNCHLVDPTFKYVSDSLKLLTLFEEKLFKPFQD